MKGFGTKGEGKKRRGGSCLCVREDLKEKKEKSERHFTFFQQKQIISEPPPSFLLSSAFPYTPRLILDLDVDIESSMPQQ